MPLDVRETRLPGVGYKFAFRLAQGGRISVILHMDGQREIYYYRRAGDDEPTTVIELHDDEARQLGAILGGAYERPKIVEELEMALGELQIEWIPVPDTSPAIGKTLDSRTSATTPGNRLEIAVICSTGTVIHELRRRDLGTTMAPASRGMGRHRRASTG